ncbi:hypothetical protein BD626DRAFT_517415 [Schizophyllum amplum]|uniref:Uncharacterized protein n=1 Tax=Schizophyllum amplum TaxID=97359 RepID=A0A550BWB4_9AGAR|nr:hypothetical protein BD626DRAFT_517415 [Auriculariopsis ampla]
MMKVGIRKDDTGCGQREGGQVHPCPAPRASCSLPDTPSSIARTSLPHPTSFRHRASFMDTSCPTLARSPSPPPSDLTPGDDDEAHLAAQEGCAAGASLHLPLGSGTPTPT